MAKKKTQVAKKSRGARKSAKTTKRTAKKAAPKSRPAVRATQAMTLNHPSQLKVVGRLLSNALATNSLSMEEQMVANKMLAALKAQGVV